MTEEIFQSIGEWCPEDYDVERIDFSEEYCQMGVEDPSRDGYRVTVEDEFEVITYTDGSTQLLRRRFREDNQRTETGFAAVVTIWSPTMGKFKVLDMRKRTCRGRASNFDMEVAAIKEAIKWSKQNRVRGTLIRLDSKAAIHRVKDTRAGPGQGRVLAIRRMRKRMEGRVCIEWIKGHDEDKGNKLADKMANEARSKSQKTITVSYLTTMVSMRMTRDNYPRILSKYYLFDYTTPKRSDLDEEGHTIASTISRLQGNYTVIGAFLHRIRRADNITVVVQRCYR